MLHLKHTPCGAAGPQGKYSYDEAEPMFREALEMYRETFGDWHPNTLTSTFNLGALQATGDLTVTEG